MGRFASTVPFYQKSRQPYGDDFFAAVAQRLGLRRDQRLLDLGTGPGLLALGFAPFVGEVCGVDPEPAMLEAARHNARRAGVALRLIEGTAETLPADIGRFHLVTIGRALHWMEPERTRLTLDRVVEDHGVVLVCSASSVADGRNPWLDAYDAVRRRGRRARALSATRSATPSSPAAGSASTGSSPSRPRGSPPWTNWPIAPSRCPPRRPPRSAAASRRCGPRSKALWHPSHRTAPCTRSSRTGPRCSAATGRVEGA